MSSPTIAAQVDAFNPGFNEQVGPVLADVFAEEQAALNAAGRPAHAVAAGAVLPEATLVAPDGSSTSLAAVLQGKPAVLVFYRGAWCPYCNITLRTYQRELLPALSERGVGLIAISPQTPEGSEKAEADWELQFAVLSDPANTLADALGIVTAPSEDAQGAHTQLGFDVADSNADSTRAIPFPTVLVVDADGIVRFADVHVDYTTRTEVLEIVAAVDAL